MTQQFSMSFRLQRQRASRTTFVRPWMIALLLGCAGSYLWIGHPEHPAAADSPVMAEEAPVQRVAKTTTALPEPAVPEKKMAFQPHELITIASIPAEIEPLAALPTKMHSAIYAKKQDLQNNDLRYTFVFEGRAMSQGKPCPNTHILVRLQEGDHTRVAHGISDGTGFYSIPVTLAMTPRNSVDWTLEADRTEYQTLEMSGRHIAMTGDTAITVERSFDLALR